MKDSLSSVKQGCLSRSRVSAVLFVAISLAGSGLAQVYAAPIYAAPRSTVADPDAIPSLSIPAEVPLRLEITHTITLKTGEPFRGRLTEPVYGPNRLLLPAGTTADGVISATPASDRGTRVNAKLDGDFTPLRLPVIRVTQLLMSSGERLSVDAVGGMRNATTISLASHPRHISLGGRVKGMIHAQVQQ